jgi:hypothetical protein
MSQPSASKKVFFPSASGAQLAESKRFVRSGAYWGTMDAEPGLSEQYRTASPWPLFVALGIPISELGILFGLFPLAVGGLLLFGGSVAGLVTESSYARTPWRALFAVSVPLFALGAAFMYTAIDLPDRGLAIVAAGVILVAAGLAGTLFTPDGEPAY